MIDLLVFPIAVWASTVIHEAGHLVAYVLVGIRPRAAGTGLPPILWTRRVGGVRLFVGRRSALSGLVVGGPDASALDRRASLLVDASGALAQLVAAGVAAVVWRSLAGELFVAWNLWLAWWSLWPRVNTDGAHMRARLGGGAPRMSVRACVQYCGLYEAIGLFEEARTLHLHAGIWCCSNALPRAAERHVEALAADPDAGTELELLQAHVASAREQWEQAAAGFESALSRGEHPMMPYGRRVFASVRAEAGLPASHPLLDAAPHEERGLIAASRELILALRANDARAAEAAVGALPLNWEGYQQLAEACLAVGDTTGAEAAASRAVSAALDACSELEEPDLGELREALVPLFRTLDRVGAAPNGRRLGDSLVRALGLRAGAWQPAQDSILAVPLAVCWFSVVAGAGLVMHTNSLLSALTAGGPAVGLGWLYCGPAWVPGMSVVRRLLLAGTIVGSVVCAWSFGASAG